MQKIIIALLLVWSLQGYSQTDSLKVVNLKGQIVHGESKRALSAAHILNLNRVEGTITSDKGFFELPTRANDTILVSYLGFASIKLKVTNDLLKGNELIIALYEKPEEVREVVIKSTKLIGVLEIDIKQVPKDRFTRIHINGLPQTYEVGKPKAKDFSSPSSRLVSAGRFLIHSFWERSPSSCENFKS